MHTSSYSTEPLPGSREYKLSGILRHYLSTLVNSSPTEIDNILQKIDYYSQQLLQLQQQNINISSAGHQALDQLHSLIPSENKKDITCSKGCTGCCYIDLHITTDEARLALEFCKENNIAVNEEYLQQQATTGRKNFSEYSRCVFLQDSVCSIYPVRPAACRKHFVKSDPALCDPEKNKVTPVDTFFDLHTEILASALLNISQADSIERVLLKEINSRRTNEQ